MYKYENHICSDKTWAGFYTGPFFAL